MVRNRDSNFEREIAVFGYPQVGVVTSSYIEILNDGKRLSEVAASAAYIHNAAALLASRDAPISATRIIDFIPDAIRKIL